MENEAIMNYEYIIDINKVSCKAGYKYLLKDITWQVKSGEHWVVFGTNGSGKTTLLSIIAGFKHFTQGKVKLFGEEYNNENILDIRKRIGWISTSFFDKYYNKESALDIVLSGKGGNLGLEYNIVLKDIIKAKDLLEELGLNSKIDVSFDLLSKGQRQNVLIARALISNPDILILDEPCTGLDVFNRSYLFNTIEELSKRKELTIIYVTHYVEEIIPLFSKTLLLKNGYVFAKGETKEIFNAKNLQKLFNYPVEVHKEQDGTYRLGIEIHSQLAKIIK